MNSVYINYKGKYDQWRNFANAAQQSSFGIVPCDFYDWLFFSSTCTYLTPPYQNGIEISNAYKLGVDWLTSINGKYKTAIGVNQVQATYTYKCCNGLSATSSCYFTTPDQNTCLTQGLYPQVASVSVTVTNDKPSDGYYAMAIKLISR